MLGAEECRKMNSTRFLFSNGVVSLAPDVPPVSSFLEAHPGMHALTPCICTTHPASLIPFVKLLFWISNFLVSSEIIIGSNWATCKIIGTCSVEVLSRLSAGYSRNGEFLERRAIDYELRLIAQMGVKILHPFFPDACAYRWYDVCTFRWRSWSLVMV